MNGQKLTGGREHKIANVCAKQNAGTLHHNPQRDLHGAGQSDCDTFDAAAQSLDFQH